MHLKLWFDRECCFVAIFGLPESRMWLKSMPTMDSRPIICCLWTKWTVKDFKIRDEFSQPWSPIKIFEIVLKKNLMTMRQSSVYVLRMCQTCSFDALKEWNARSAIKIKSLLGLMLRWVIIVDIEPPHHWKVAIATGEEALHMWSFLKKPACCIAFYFKVVMATKTKTCALEASKTPGTMNAIVIRAPGGPEVMEFRTVEEAKAKCGEVLIKVVAAGLNKADCMQRKGNHNPPEGESLYPGLECSGYVEAIGPGVTKWQVGDEVRITKFVSTFEPPMGLVSALGIVIVGNAMNT